MSALRFRRLQVTSVVKCVSAPILRVYCFRGLITRARRHSLRSVMRRAVPHATLSAGIAYRRTFPPAGLPAGPLTCVRSRLTTHLRIVAQNNSAAPLTCSGSPWAPLASTTVEIWTRFHHRHPDDGGKPVRLATYTVADSDGSRRRRG